MRLAESLNACAGFRFRWLCLAFTALAVLATTVLPCYPAHAQSPSARKQPTAVDRETARSLVGLGHQRFAAKDLQGALEAYDGADAIMGVPTTGILVGKTQLALGRLIASRDTLLRVARYPVKPAEPSQYTNARNEAKQLAREIGTRIPSLQVRVTGVTKTSELEVKVDDVLLVGALVKLPRKLDPGLHTISVSCRGYLTHEQTVTVAESDQRVVEVVLVADPAAGKTQPVNSALGLKSQPPNKPKPAPQPHDTSPDRPDGPDLTTLAYIAFGLGGAGLVLGTITGAVSLSTTSDLKDRCPTTDTCPESVRPDYDRALALANVSNVSFALGAVGIGVGLIAVLLDSDSEPSQTASPKLVPGLVVRPQVGIGVVGLEASF